MEKEDLIAGEYYHFDFGNHQYIGIARGEGTDHLLQHMSLKHEALYNNSSRPSRDRYTMGSSIRKCRLATLQERAWLDACMKENKFLNKNDNWESTYDIY
jgi:hypothetical protein